MATARPKPAGGGAWRWRGPGFRHGVSRELSWRGSARWHLDRFSSWTPGMGAVPSPGSARSPAVSPNACPLRTIPIQSCACDSCGVYFGALPA